MSGARFQIDASGIEKLQEMMDRVERPGEIIDRVLKEEGAELIKQNIMPLLPVSGRKWKGKRTAASQAQPFTEEFAPLTVIVKTKPTYHYLYFPDDGAFTANHQGNQHFMLRGGEAAQDEIIDRCVAALQERLQGG